MQSANAYQKIIQEQKLKTEINHNSLNKINQRYARIEHWLIGVSLIITAILGVLTVQSSVKVNQAQNQLQNIRHQVSVYKQQNAQLQQSIDELTTQNRLNHIAQQSGLHLNPQNIQNIK